MALEGRQSPVACNPVRFVRQMLHDDTWSRQNDILRGVAKYPRTAVKACHASGKTRIAADALVWWMLRYPDGIVITTAPTWVQIQRLLWGEVHRAINATEIDLPKANATDWQLSSGNYALGLSTNEGVRFQGFHGDHVLIILDEAPGVRADIWEAIEGARAGGDVRVLALGNPTIASGPFYDAFGRNADLWHTITISAFDTPNFDDVEGIDGLLAMSADERSIAVRPYLTTRAWVWEKYHEWGPGHPLYQSRVLGQFPDQTDDALIGLSQIELARLTMDGAGGVLYGGMDVAGPGEDETVLTIRSGTHLILERWWTDADPRGELMAALAPYKGRLKRLCIDSAGIGYYLCRHFQDAGYPVVDVNVGESPRNKERYRNLKAELYWGLRMRFAEGDVSGAFSDVMVSQLASIRWRTNARGQIEIESKDDLRKRGAKSPDRAEALMLTYADLGTGELGIRGVAATFGTAPHRLDRRAMPT